MHKTPKKIFEVICKFVYEKRDHKKRTVGISCNYNNYVSPNAKNVSSVL